MALTNTDRKVIHTGNGSATVFPYGFPILDAAHLSVIYTDAGGAEMTLSPSLYSVTGIGALAGGSVTYPKSGSALATGTKLTIVRTVPYTQTTVLSNQGGYYPEVVERRFDEIYMAMQQLAEIVGRYTVSSISDPVTEQSNYALIQAVQTFQGGIDKLTTQGDLLTRDGTSYKRLPRGTSGQFLGITGPDLAWQTPAAYPILNSARRQTVAAGPVTTAGLPDILSTNLSALSIPTINVSATYPLVATAAAGWSATNGSPVDAIGYTATNLTWSGLTPSRAAATPNFLYVTIAAGLMTTGSTLLPPIYQWGGTPGTAAGQFTFNIAEMRGYLGNGTAAPQVNLVMVGEGATNGTGVISTVAYAYNGRYDSGYSGDLPATNTAAAKSHNLGVHPRVADFIVECTSAEVGYAVGDQACMGSLQNYDGASVRLPALSWDKKGMSVISSVWNLINKSTAVATQLTPNKWKWRMIADRGW